MFWKSKKPAAEPTPPAPLENIHLARQALKQNDSAHAVRHLAEALSVEPRQPDGLRLLDQVIAASPDPLALVAWEKPPIPYPLVAVRAYIHVQRGEPDTALALMAQLYQAIPGQPFLPWLTNWLTDDQLLARVSPDTLVKLLNQLNSKVKAPMSFEDFEAFEKMLPTLSRFWEKYQSHVMLTALLSIQYRELGRCDKAKRKVAINLAQIAHKTEPSYLTTVVLAGAYRDNFMFEEAVTNFRQALNFDPDDLAIRLDIGDLLCDIGQIREGLEVYQEILDRQPGHEWAYPSYLYYRGILEPAGQWQKQLEEFAKKNSNNQRAADLHHRQVPFLNTLPDPDDATINLAREVLAKQGFIPSLEIQLSSLEAPSAYRALQLRQLETENKSSFTWAVAEIQKPDPRLPRGEVDFVLWRYDGNIPSPNLPPPAPEVAALVAELASLPYEANTWWSRAVKYSEQIGSARLHDLLGMMLFPPPRPAEFEMWVWLQRVQVAATFIIARLDEGWEGSLRRRTLLSLAHGPMDWTVGTAILVLSLLINRDGLGQAEIESLYLELFQNMPHPGGVPYSYVLTCCTFYIGATLPTLSQYARNWLDINS